MIRFDSIAQYLNTIRSAKTKIYSLINTPGFSHEFNLAIIKELNRLSWYYAFSKPIYLRANTLAVLYLESLCGRDCGNEELIIYRKVNGSWKSWMYVPMGDF